MAIKPNQWSRYKYPERYLADVSGGQFHDLTHETSECQIGKIIANHNDTAYEYKLDARRAGYVPCRFCMPDEAKLSGL